MFHMRTFFCAMYFYAIVLSQNKAFGMVDGKPEIVYFYNKTKSGVDALDQKVSHYSCRRKIRRWPMALFFYIIDVAAYNAFTIFGIENNSKQQYRQRHHWLLT